MQLSKYLAIRDHTCAISREDSKELPAILRLKGIKIATTCTEAVGFESSSAHKLDKIYFKCIMLNKETGLINPTTGE
jgi:hypothetical protein